MNNIFLIYTNNEITRLKKGMSKKHIQQIFGGDFSLIEAEEELNRDLWLCTF
jgi:hypothetical protein